LQFNEQSVRVLFKVHLVYADDFTGRVIAFRQPACELLGTLRYQPGICAIKEHGTAFRIGRFHKLRSLMRLNSNHGDLAGFAQLGDSPTRGSMRHRRLPHQNKNIGFAQINVAKGARVSG
jgi:hypothetical protein